MKNILVLFGGVSPEYEVSLHSAAGVLRNMDRARFRPVTVGISRQGGWYACQADPEAVAADRWRERPRAPALLSCDRERPGLLVFDRAEPRRVPLDGAFPVLHGRNGEDGTAQGLLELAGLPIVGCGTLASALCMDKDRAHRLAAAAGVRVPRSALALRGGAPERALALANELGYPLFVKPVRAGSSFGVSRVEGPEALAGAVEKALLYDSAALLEEAVPGCEVGCAVLGRDRLLTGEPDEIELAGGFFDYKEKYGLVTSRIHVPARVTGEKAEEIKAAAKTIYRALGCEGFARVDLFLTPAGELVFNEVNTIPGFTEHSRFPAMMAAAGLPLRDVVTMAIEEAVGP